MTYHHALARRRVVSVREMDNPTQLPGDRKMAIASRPWANMDWKEFTVHTLPNVVGNGLFAASSSKLNANH